MAFYIDSKREVDAAYERCLEVGARIHYPPEGDRDIEGYHEHGKRHFAAEVAALSGRQLKMGNTCSPKRRICSPKLGRPSMLHSAQARSVNGSANETRA